MAKQKTISLEKLEEKYFGAIGTPSRAAYESDFAKRLGKLFVKHNRHLKKLSAVEKKALSYDIWAVLIGYSSLKNLEKQPTTNKNKKVK